MNYGELAEFARALPVLRQKTLHCHPSVLTVLREKYGQYADPVPLPLLYGNPSPSAVDIFTGDDLPPGYWELREDGGPVARGCIAQEDE